MAYTKYSLTPADNNAAPPNGAPEGMLPSAVNDTMRDMMSQIRDCGDGIRGGTYTMTAPVITGGSINGTTTITTSGAISYTGTLTGGTGVVNLGSGQFYKDASGNVGIGVTPSAWSTANSIKALQIPSGALWNFSNNYLYLGQNYYWNGSNRIYINTDGASEYQQNAGTHVWFTAASGTAGNAITFSERMRIDSAGNVGIGTSSPAYPLQVAKGNPTNGWLGVLDNTTPNGNGCQLALNLNSVGTTAIGMPSNTNALAFYVNGATTERMRIDSNGNLLVGTTSYSTSAKGTGLGADGLAYHTRNGDVPLIVNRLTNDGTLVSLQQETTEEGFISVSGSTVSYNGGHLARWSQLPDGSKDDSILKGTVLSNLDDMCVWIKDGETLLNEQLNKMKVSDAEGDTNVAGVFVNWTRDEQCNTDDMNVAMTGDMIVRIADGVVVQKGDLLVSAGDGTAKPQGDDIVRSKTIAKVTSNYVTCTYADGSYCVPCVLMAC